MTKIVFASRNANPVSPANLSFDDPYSLIARMVCDVFEEYPTSKDRYVYRTYAESYNLVHPPLPYELTDVHP